MSANRTAHPMSRLAWVFSSVAGVVLAMSAPASAQAASGLTGPGLQPSGNQTNGIPAGGTCGVGGAGTYIKFTTGGGSTLDGTANATAGQPYTATYASDETAGLFQVTSLKDATGTPMYFDSLVGNAKSTNPVWSFAPTTAPAPVLGSTGIEGANFTQFAVCAYSNVTFQVRKAVVGTTTTQAFPVTWACDLGATTISGGATLTDGQTSAPITVPAGSTCTATDSVTGYTTTAGTVGPLTASGSVATVTNTRQLGSIDITKQQVGGADQTWDFAVSCSNTYGETFTGTASVTGSGTTTVSGIPTGLSCTVKELQANVLPFDTDLPSQVVGVPGAVTFTNTKRASVNITKTENGGVPTHVYTFTLTGPSGTITKATAPNVTGALDFGYVRPGTYTFCETQVAAGTTPTLASWPGATTNATTGDVCAPMVLTAGQEVVTTIDNRIGEGGRRTIGYWKNWASCTATAGQLANAARTGKKLLDDVLPLSLGGYTVTTCTTGTTILGTSAGKYAENALAAQLLAAKANVAVAGAPQDVLDAIAKADALLAQISYQGSPSSIVGSNHPLRADILAVAALLDDFNNGRLG